MPSRAASAKASLMPRGSPTITALRVLTALAVALAAMCAFLAWQWKTERDRADCWRAYAEFQLQPEGNCGT